MNRKLLIGIIIVFVIAAAISVRVLPMYLFLAVWIYLVWMVWKKKISLFRDHMEPKLAERRLKRLKKFLLVATIGVAAFWVNIILMFVIYRTTGFPSSEEEEGVFFFIGLLAAVLFLIGTIGGLIIFLKGRQKTT